MILFRSPFSIRFKPAARGILAGLALSMVGLIAALPVLVPSAQGAASAKDSCFTVLDCSPALKDEPNCKNGDQGCCKGDRCWVPRGSGCAKQGSVVLGSCLARNSPFTLSVNFGAATTVVDLSDYIAIVYQYAIGIGGMVAAVMMMIGGMMYLTAADSDRISRGKQFIVDALTGLFVILGAYMLLNTINPDIVSLALPKVPVVKKQSYVGCSYTRKCAACGMNYFITQKFIDDLAAGKTGQDAVRKVDDGGNGKMCDPTYVSATDGVTSCTGKGCHCLNEYCTDNITSCQKVANNSKSKCGWDSSLKVAAGGTPSGMRKPGDTGAAAPAAGGSGGQAAAPAAGGSGGQAAAPPAQPDWGCFSCDPDGQSCSPNGPSDKCCSGFCGKGKCSSGEPGEPCSSDNKECNGGYCQTSWGNSCSKGDAGSPCDENGECLSGKCVGGQGAVASNACGTGAAWTRCFKDSDCGTGRCVQSFETTAGAIFHFLTGGWSSVMSSGGVCAVDGSALISCSAAAGVSNECVTKSNGALSYCVNFIMQGNFCSDGKVGAYCTNNNQCVDGHCITSGTPSLSVCSSGAPGSICDDFKDCVDGHCYDGGDFDVCTTGKLGSRCKVDDDCDQTAGFKCATVGYDSEFKRCSFPQGTKATYCAGGVAADSSPAGGAAPAGAAP